jgi:ribosomal protein L37E
MNAGRNNRQGEVICLHCGMDTPVPATTSCATVAGIFLELDHHISIVRCRSCGKEAPYLASDILVLAEAANAARIGA